MAESRCQEEANLGQPFDSIWDAIMMFAVIPLLVAFGLVSNTICFIIIKSCPYIGVGSTPFLLRIMLLAESAVLVFSLFEHTFNTILTKFQEVISPTILNIYTTILGFAIPTSYLIHRFAILIVLLITFEQYLIVFRPSRFKRLISKKKFIKNSVVWIFGALVLITLPDYLEPIEQIIFEGKIKELGNDSEETASDERIESAYYQVTTMGFVFYHSIYLVLIVILPYIAYALL